MANKKGNGKQGQSRSTSRNKELGKQGKKAKGNQKNSKGK